MHINLRIPSFCTDKLTLGLHGKEHVYFYKQHSRQVAHTRLVTDTEGNSRTETYYETEYYYLDHNGESCLIAVSFELQRFQGSMMVM